MSVAVVLFRNTSLRVCDNLVLHKALADAECTTLLPLYIWDERFNGNWLHNEDLMASRKNHGRTWNFGFPRLSPLKKRFLLSCILDVKSSFQALQSDLMVANPQKPICSWLEHDLFPQLLSSNQKVKIFMGSDLPCHEEQILETELQVLAKRLRYMQVNLVSNNYTMYDHQELPFKISDLPDVYSHFRTAIEKASVGKANGSGLPLRLVKRPVPAPSVLKPLPPPPARPMPGRLSIEDLVMEVSRLEALIPKADNSALPFEGGEKSALARLQSYMNAGVNTYKTTRNGLLGPAYSTKFSPFLSHGCISPRTIVDALRQLGEKDRDGAYWVWFELLWREYFNFVGSKFGKRIFLPHGLSTPKDRNTLPWKHGGFNHPLFKAWCEGTTGVPFVDANMRELQATGFMSNRGRQNVASFLIKDLGLDWRLGAEWFESLLLDHDPCSNYGNWLYIAGLGNDPRQADDGNGRYFNVIKQARDYDPKAEYVLTWCPELKGHPNPHVPWTQSVASKSFGIYLKPPIARGKGWDRHYAIRVRR
jgi:deoxyribodipyrimidine photo-lyase